MLTITNVAAVQAAFDSKTPRPMREIMLEIYPDATEDANGRFHAPYDGYECPLTGGIFRAGEFLPMEEPEDSYRVMGSRVNCPQGVDLEGNIHRWSGTRAQNAAAWKELLQQSRAHDARCSNHLGKVGEKIELELTIEHVASFQGYYGPVFIHIMKDGQGNVVIYKGKRLRTGKNPYLDKDLGKGDKIRLAAKVKAHGEREGVKQTIIERPKVI